MRLAVYMRESDVISQKNLPALSSLDASAFSVHLHFDDPWPDEIRRISLVSVVRIRLS